MADYLSQYRQKASMIGGQGFPYASFKQNPRYNQMSYDSNLGYNLNQIKHQGNYI